MLWEICGSVFLSHGTCQQNPLKSWGLGAKPGSRGGFPQPSPAQFRSASLPWRKEAAQPALPSPARPGARLPLHFPLGGRRRRRFHHRLEAGPPSFVSGLLGTPSRPGGWQSGRRLAGWALPLLIRSACWAFGHLVGRPLDLLLGQTPGPSFCCPEARAGPHLTVAAPILCLPCPE